MRERLAILLRAVSVRRGHKWVLRDISWRLRPGERWALLGDNGAGKTQLLKLLSGDVWPTPGKRAARSPRRRQRANLSGRPPAGRSDRCQAAGRLRGRRTAGQVRPLWMEPAGARPGGDRTASHRLLLRPSRRRRPRAWRPHCEPADCAVTPRRQFLALSYGQKRLALLARALVQHPDWLLLDELYNGLDAAYRRRMDAVLEAARRRGQSWVASAHRAADVPRGTRPPAGTRGRRGTRRSSGCLQRISSVCSRRAGESAAGGRAQARASPGRAGRRRCAARSRRSICTSSIARCCAISIGSCARASIGRCTARTARENPVF